MTLQEHFENSGRWLFRWRSYLPLVLIIFVLMALRNFTYPGGSHALDLLWEVLCLSLSFCGIALRFFTVGSVTKGTSGRVTKRQKAAALNTNGLYSIARHPLYGGNFLMWLGIALMCRSFLLVAVFITIFWLYYERIMFAEERFLAEKFGERFISWAAVTPAFLPKIKNWKPSTLPFSFKTALKREYHTVTAVIVSFTAVEILGDFVAEGTINFDIMWMIIFSACILFYLTMWLLHKRTNLLRAEGR